MGSPADEWGWCVEALKECQAHAETVGVRIGLEPLNRFETYFLNRCEQALALADAVGGDCGVALDAFHMNIEESDLLARDPRRGRPARGLPRRRQQPHAARATARSTGTAIVRELAGDRLRGPHDGRVRRLAWTAAPISDRTEIGDASEAGGGAAMEKFLRDHATGAVPEAYYDRYAQDSIDHLRAALGRELGAGGLMPAVALIGTLDTKGDEIAYVRDRLRGARRAAPS